MIRRRGLVLIFLFLLFPFISAIEVDMKSEYSQGETLISKVSGNFLDQITEESVFFYRGHVRIPMEFDVAKIDGDFYIYALLGGKQENNYSVSIEGVRYMSGTQIYEDDIVGNFSITNKTADFSVDPGFIITNKDFFIETQNILNEEITIDVRTSTSTFSGEEEGDSFFDSIFGSGGTTETSDGSVSLKSGETKKIYFSIENLTQSTLKKIELSTHNLEYEIPVYIIVEEKQAVEKEKEFRFEPSTIDLTMSTNSDRLKIAYLSNTGEELLENISLAVSDTLLPYLSLSTYEIDELEENSSKKLEIYITSDSDEKSIEGSIRAESKKNGTTITEYLDVDLFFVKDFISLEEKEGVLVDGKEGSDEQSTSNTCLEISGEICATGEECIGESRFAKDGNCCLGSCEEIKESSTGKIVGWTIIILIIFFSAWFFLRKYRGAKKELNLFEISKGRR